MERIVVPLQFILKEDKLLKIFEKGNLMWDKIKGEASSLRSWSQICVDKLSLKPRTYNVWVDSAGESPFAVKESYTQSDDSSKICVGGIWNSYPKYFHQPDKILDGVKTMVILGNSNGMWSCFVNTLECLMIADAHDIDPVVFWGDHSIYWDNDSGNNSWEYYFKSIGDNSTYAEHIKTIHENMTGDGRYSEYRQRFGDVLVIGSSSMKIPFFEGSIPYNFGFRGKGKVVTDYWRNLVNLYIRKYIKVNSKILDAVDVVVKNMSGLKIGVHMRGGNVFDEYLTRKNHVYLEHYEKAINDIVLSLQVNDETQTRDYSIYVATDSKRALDYMKSKFANVFAIECSRTEAYYADRIGMSEVHSYGHMLDRRSKLGFESIMECMILSRCDVMIHYESNLAVMASYMNPSLRLVHAELYRNQPYDSVDPAPVLSHSSNMKGVKEDVLKQANNDDECRHGLLWLDWVKGKVNWK